MGGAATPEDPRGEDEGRSCQVQHRPWRSWQLVYSSPRGISQGLLQLFRQQWQRTKWILRPLEPHPRAPLEHLLLTRYIFLRFSERRSAFHHHHGRHQSSGLVLIPHHLITTSLLHGAISKHQKKATGVCIIIIIINTAFISDYGFYIGYCIGVWVCGTENERSLGPQDRRHTGWHDSRCTCPGDFIESLPLSAATQRQRWIYPNSFYIPDNFIVIVLYL